MIIIYSKTFDIMAEKYVLVENSCSVSSVLKRTFQSMQRIKLCCFDVSNNYIVFGASSGGIYIFSREPCNFLKLIPSRAGLATNVCISQNEKNLAISSDNGLVVVLENFSDLNLKYEVYSEHEGQTITAIKWHNDYLFCGDTSGKVSITSVSNVLSKAIFNSSCTSLMHLDSAIVQIDTFSKYLIISTHSRAFFCDTEKEQYRQIGKKLRVGPYGACFFNVTNANDEEIISVNRTMFHSLKDDESFSSYHNKNGVKIFCARPGARLWEVNFEATVLQTHQFRHSFLQSPSDVIHLGDSDEPNLNISTFNKTLQVPFNFKFEKIYNFLNKFVFTYNSEGIYIFDVVGSTLAFWNNSIQNIIDVKIVNSFIYIWQNNLQVTVLSLLTLEELILKILFKKHYNLCAQICIRYSKDVYSLIETSKRIHLISILESKELISADLLEKISDILTKIREHTNKRKLLKKVNGVAIVDNLHSIQHHDLIPESVETFKEDPCKQINNKHNVNIEIFYKQYKLNKTHKTVEIPAFCKIFENLTLIEIFNLVKKFISHVKETDGESALEWCQEQLLRQISKRTIVVNDLDSELKEFLKNAFLDVNKSLDIVACNCCFPLPTAHNLKPKYYNLGCQLLQNERSKDYLKIVPYLYKDQFKIHSFSKNNLSLLIQFCDIQIIEEHTMTFTYDDWDEILKHFAGLKKGCCLNCGQKIKIDGIISWAQLSLLIIKSIGSQNSTKLLKRYSDVIPKGDLDFKFYQTCILSSISPEKPNTNEKKSNILDESLNTNPSAKLDNLLASYLQNKYLRSSKDGISSFLEDSISSNQEKKCSFCNLPLNNPVLDKITSLDCGHSFHNLCINNYNLECFVCNKK